MKLLRTPDERFRDLADFPFAPHYTTIFDAAGDEIRIRDLVKSAGVELK